MQSLSVTTHQKSRLNLKWKSSSAQLISTLLDTSIIAERLSARHPNSAAHSRLAMYVPMYLCQSRFRNANYCVDNDVKMADTLTFIFPVPDGPRPDHGY